MLAQLHSGLPSPLRLLSVGPLYFPTNCFVSTGGTETVINLIDIVFFLRRAISSQVRTGLRPNGLLTVLRIRGRSLRLPRRSWTASEKSQRSFFRRGGLLDSPQMF